MPDAQFNMMETNMNQFVVGIPLISSLVNPGNQEYKTFFIEDRGRHMFSSTLGNYLIAEVQEDTIENDISLMPYEEI